MLLADYNGPQMKFLISRSALTEIPKHGSNCEVAESSLKIDTGRYTYLAHISKPDEGSEG